jgi:hypothetical protein
MSSLLFWLGLVVMAVGLGLIVFVSAWLRTGVGLAAGGIFFSVVVLLLFAYGPSADPGPFQLPPGARAVALALAFEDDTPAEERRRGALRPGLANEHLAHWLTEHAGSFALILAQEAILKALVEEPFHDGITLKGTPVYRMHAHDGSQPVRTLEALCCALHRLRDQSPTVLVVVAHGHHAPRVCADLRTLSALPVVDAGLRDVPYRNQSALLPVAWATRELAGAQPLDFWQRTFFKASACRCGDAALAGLGPIPAPRAEP